MDEFYEEALTLGREHGRNAGSWVIDGNTSEETARAILTGYENGDPRVMDMQPWPLSGEWAGDLTISEILEYIGVVEDDHENPGGNDELLDAYEQGFSEAFWDEVISSAQAKV